MVVGLKLVKVRVAIIEGVHGFLPSPQEEWQFAGRS
jgi:hypothetical protein